MLRQTTSSHHGHAGVGNSLVTCVGHMSACQNRPYKDIRLARTGAEATRNAHIGFLECVRQPRIKKFPKAFLPNHAKSKADRFCSGRGTLLGRFWKAWAAERTVVSSLQNNTSKGPMSIGTYSNCPLVELGVTRAPRSALGTCSLGRARPWVR